MNKYTINSFNLGLKHNLILLSASLLLFSGCSSTKVAPTSPSNKSTTETQAASISPSSKTTFTQPPSNAEAMETAKPLGTVTGKLVTLASEPYSTNEFAEAVKYAEEMQSYALLVWHKGALRLEHYFNDFDAQLRSETASMHKSVLGLLVAAAIEDGYIQDVDTPIKEYISEWRDQAEGEITVRQLLTMSSGLTKLSSEGGFNSETMRFFSGQLNARETIMGLRLESTPGENFAYTNTNSQLLAVVLEGATKMPYAKYLSQRLWQPLGADDASVWYYEETGFPRVFSSLLARARDWVKVGLLIKNNGEANGKQLISKDLMKNITASSATNLNYGWQLWLGRKAEQKRYYNDTQTGVSIPASEPFNVDDMIYFDGFGGQRVYISESADVVIVRVGDTRLDWDDTYLPNLIINKLKNRDKN